jgi:N-acetylglucosamine malate deacetylase 1
MIVLTLSPHMDDSELGAGATLSMLAKNNEVYHVTFSDSENSNLYYECSNANNHLQLQAVRMLDFKFREFPKQRQEILDQLYQLNEWIKPELVFIPNRDCHQDHQVIHDEALRAFKYSSILAYELPWNNLSFKPSFFTILSEAQLQTKINALSEYKSQQHRNYFNMDFIKAWAKYRGVQHNTEYAEAFEVVKWHFNKSIDLVS